MKPSELLERHREAWTAVTRHPFLDGVRDGPLPRAAFTAWLAQDHRFVADLLVFQARLLARAPRPAQAVLAAGLVGLEAELSWFEEQARSTGLTLDVARHLVAAEYHRFLVTLEEEPYAAAITALWALERAYLDAWRNAAPGAPAYRAWVEHWTTPAFAEYVARLEAAAGAALTSESALAAAEQAFLEVARLERDFWEMAWSESSA